MTRSLWTTAAWRWIGGLLCLVAALTGSVSAGPAPIVVEPSQYWEGDDGAWSTFFLRLGSPDQVVRVLVSTAMPNTVAVANTSCEPGQSASCASDRGAVFAPDASSTWQFNNSYGIYSELNFTGAEEPASFGLDSITLGLSSSGTKLDDQVIAAIESTDYYVGLLGINPQVTNWTEDFHTQSDSLFKTLNTQKLIPSYTYSYTAGAKYRSKGILGSLTFGGYDASRAKPPAESFHFTMADDVSRDLVVAIQSITTDANKGAVLLSQNQAILAYIDSTFPYFVLPLEICREFEKQFDLQWNPNAGPNGMYTLNDTQHAALQAANPSVTFVLGNDRAGGPTTNVTLPYAAFDLQASPPLVNSKTAYFPLLRAANDTQITLGRAFLQEAMLVVDYTHNNFSVWPCTWDAAADSSTNIVTLGAPDASSPGDGGSAGASHDTAPTLPLALGLGLGLGLLVILAAILAYVLFRRRRQRRPSPQPHDHSGPSSHATADTTAIMSSTSSPNFSSSELDATTMRPIAEKDGYAFKRGHEVVGCEAAREMDGSSRASSAREMADSSRASSWPRQELPGTPVSSSALIEVHMSSPRWTSSVLSSSSSLSFSLVSPASGPEQRGGSEPVTTPPKNRFWGYL